MSDIETLRREAEEARHALNSTSNTAWISEAWATDMNRDIAAYGEAMRSLGRAEGAAEMRERCAQMLADHAAALVKYYERLEPATKELGAIRVDTIAAEVHAIRALSPAAPDRRETPPGPPDPPRPKGPKGYA